MYPQAWRCVTLVPSRQISGTADRIQICQPWLKRNIVRSDQFKIELISQ